MFPHMITTKLHPAFNSEIDDNVDGIQVDHNRILADLVESNLTLVGIARDHKLNLSQLIAWAAQPAIRALLAAAAELAHCVADLKATQGRAGAVETLIRHTTGLCETPRDRDLASRAARTLVRISQPPKPRSPRKVQDTSPPPSEGAGAKIAAAAGAVPAPSLQAERALAVPSEPIERPEASPFRVPEREPMLGPRVMDTQHHSTNHENTNGHPTSNGRSKTDPHPP